VAAPPVITTCSDSEWTREKGQPRSAAPPVITTCSDSEWTREKGQPRSAAPPVITTCSDSEWTREKGRPRSAAPPVITTCSDSEWTREKGRPRSAAPPVITTCSDSEWTRERGGHGVPPLQLTTELAQMCRHVIVASAYSKPAKKVVSAYLEWSPTPMRSRALPCIFCRGRLRPCYEPTSIKKFGSFARNRVTEETDLSNQGEIAALAEASTH
jgi:hypothetical protein